METESDIYIGINDSQNEIEIDGHRLQEVIIDILRRSGFNKGEISVAIVDDNGIINVNSKFLESDDVTDVIAFTYDKRPELGLLDGEIVINAGEALRHSKELNHGPFEELLLYAAHGILHLLGWDDRTPLERNKMNREAVSLLEAANVRVDDSTLITGG